MVYGPVIHRVGTVKDLNASSGDIYRLIDGSEKDIPDTSFWAFADVRDGERPYTYQTLDAERRLLLSQLPRPTCGRMRARRPLGSGT